MSDSRPSFLVVKLAALKTADGVATLYKSAARFKKNKLHVIVPNTLASLAAVSANGSLPGSQLKQAAMSEYYVDFARRMAALPHLQKELKAITETERLGVTGPIASGHYRDAQKAKSQLKAIGIRKPKRFLGIK